MTSGRGASESTQIICIMRKQRPIKTGADWALPGAKGRLDSPAPARHDNRTFGCPVCASSVCGRGHESCVCALDCMRGSSFVMGGDVCGSRSYPLPHTQHTHLGPQGPFLRGRMGIPLLYSHCQSQLLGAVLPYPITHLCLPSLQPFLYPRASNTFVFPASPSPAIILIFKEKQME